jgi:serine/threonine-protein kinase
VYVDARAAWTGTLPDFPGTAVRIEAAALNGAPVFWRMIVPSWDNFSTGTLPSVQLLPGTGRKAGDIIANVVFVLLLLVGPAFFARRNLRLGRGDRSGAVRLVCFITILLGATWIFREHHLATSNELFLFVLSAALWLLFAGWIWMMYIALEPYARRRWPGMLVAWSRLLAGNYRDPMVGRDLLVGTLTAAILVAVAQCSRLISLLGSPQGAPGTPHLAVFSGSNWILGRISEMIWISILLGLAAAFTFFILRVLLRSTWAAAIVPTLLVAMSAAFSRVNDGLLASIVAFLLAALQLGCMIFTLLRFGLLALISFVLFGIIFSVYPIDALSGWYSGVGLTGLALLLALAFYSFYTSLGGRPMFGRASLED